MSKPFCKIPTHWEECPLGSIAEFFKGLSILKTDLVEDGVAVINYGQIHSKVNTGTKLEDSLIRRVPPSLAYPHPASKLSYGDLVFADTSEDLDGVGNLILIDRSENEIYAGYHTIVCRVNKSVIRAKYLAYQCTSRLWRDNLRASATGVKVYSVTRKLLANSRILIPSLTEQDAIVKHLDSETQKLHQAINLLQQQIEALEAYKKSLIHEAVTKGLDSSVLMKDSGIDWIGQIPAHWTLNPLKSLCLLKTGQTPPSDDLSFYDGDISWYTPGDINNVSVANSNRTLTYKAIQSGKAPLIQKESVLLVCIGATVGKSGYAQGFCSFNQQITALTPKGEDLAKWLFYAVQNFARVIKSLALYSTIPILNNLFLSGFKVPTPPIEEQQQIASYLDERCGALDRALELKREQLELLKQHRQSLIFEYVTGKRRIGQE